MITNTKLGNEIIQVGRVESLFEDWPAFAAVATNPDRSKIMTNLRSFVRDRAYTVTTLTSNLEGSAELSTFVTRVVGSLVIHPVDSNDDGKADAPRRPRVFCYRW